MRVSLLVFVCPCWYSYVRVGIRVSVLVFVCLRRYVCVCVDVHSLGLMASLFCDILTCSGPPDI